MKRLGFAALVLLSLSTVASADPQPVCDSGLAAYKATLYPLQRASCVECHGDGGIAIGHSVSDPAKAYQVTRTLVDFSNLASSTIIEKVKQQHWLSYGGGAINVTPDQVLGLLQKWWDQGERSCPSHSGFMSQSVPVPATLPDRTTGRFATLEWDLGKSSPEFKGCLFQVDIQQFTPAQGQVPGSYRLKSPRIGCVGHGVHVAGVWFPVNGSVLGYENVYAGVSQELKALSSPRAELFSLSSEYEILIQRNPTGGSISVMIDILSLRLG